MGFIEGNKHNDREALASGVALAKYWMRQLPKAECAILSVLAVPPRRAWSKAELGLQTGYEPSAGGFNNALSRLRTLLLIEGKTGLIVSRSIQNRPVIIASKPAIRPIV
jgi:hypothetical protein